MPNFLKHYAHEERAREALRRTIALRRHGVATPAAQEGPNPNTLIFNRIDGQTGHDLIAGPLGPLLEVVRQLHGATMSDLPTFDPLLRIRPRLKLTDDPLLQRIAEGTVPKGRALLHGDLHVRQFIQDPAGRVWLLDLDDLALGPPEADLANFAAHLATTDPSLGIAEWKERVCREWTLLGCYLESSVFARFLHLALLRRHLKLREARRPDYMAEIRSYLRDSSSFSIR